MRERTLIAAIILAYIAIGILYAIYTPPWQAPDEPAHYNYIAYIAHKGRLPVLQMGDYPHQYLEEIKSRRFPPDMSIEPIRYEFHQPPLYYLLAVPVYVTFGGALIPLRLFSVLLGAGVVWVAYRLVREIFPGPVALGTAAFVAFVPMHVAMTASVNNDVLAELILALFLLELVRWMKQAAGARRRPAINLPQVEKLREVHKNDGGTPSVPPGLKLAFLIALGLLTKTTTYIAIPLLAVGLLLGLRATSRKQTEGRPSLPPGAGVRLVHFWPLLLALPWFVRNALVYGPLDPLGLARHDAIVVGQPRTAEWAARMGWPELLKTFVLTTFHSFWGQFGWMAVPMDERVYVMLALLCFLALWGSGFFLFTGLRGLSSLQRQALGILTLSFGLTAASYLWYNLKFVQHQGRYLFPALIPIGLGFCLGIREALKKQRMALAGMLLAVCLAALVVKGAITGDWNRFTILALLGASGACGIKALLPDEEWLDTLLFAGLFVALSVLDVFCLFYYVVPYLSR
ncbi:MAG TPA: hypothetical protein ENG33_10755 [Chloroflexi bacterium]|nr:hypothetical protein [Chloroflexota bacterium]